MRDEFFTPLCRDTVNQANKGNHIDLFIVVQF